MINHTRSLLLAGLVAAAAAIAIAGGAFRAAVAAARSDSRPNVILILVDDMGWSALAARYPDIVKSLATEWNAWAERARVDRWPGPRRLAWGDDAPAPGRRGK